MKLEAAKLSVLKMLFCCQKRFLNVSCCGLL